MRNWAVFLGVFGAACAGTPQTDPPTGPLVLGPPGLHPELVSVEEQSPGTRSMVGEPGAVVAGGSEPIVSVINLDSTESALRVPVNPDGSFVATVSAGIGDEIRMLAWADHLASSPHDFSIEASGPVTIDQSGLCWRIAPESHLWFFDTTSETATVTNDCTQPLLLSRVAPRLSQQSFSVTSWPSEIAPGSQVEILLAYSQSGPDIDEDVLLIEATAPEPARVPLTLVGQTTE